MVSDLIFHNIFLKHEMSPGHPERPERLQWAMKSIEDSKLLNSDLQIVEAKPVSLEEIYKLHQKEYIKSIKEKSERGGGYYTLDTAVNRYTFEAAVYAAGGGVLAVDRITDRLSNSAFVLCRPPGHHAEYDRAFGFCFINNIAVAANHLISNRQFERILIVDYDAHHGNGTQNMFFETDKVLYIGLHQDGRTLFPGSGFVDEIGSGQGRGYTVNIPMYPGAGRESYAMAFEEIIEPIAASYQPEFVLVSAGFDCHHEDPLTMLGLTLHDIDMINRRLMSIAERYSNGRIAIFLEGGYNLDVIATGARITAEALVGKETVLPKDEYDESDIVISHTQNTIKKLKQHLGERWQ